MLVRNLNPHLELYAVADTESVEYAFVGDISCSFPSPADDYMDKFISLDEQLINNRHSTIFGKVRGLSMIDVGLEPDDVLIIDKDIEPQDGDLVICRLDGEFTCKTLSVENGVVRIVAENIDFEPIIITEDNEFIIEGVVTYVIKKKTRKPKSKR